MLFVVELCMGVNCISDIKGRTMLRKIFGSKRDEVAGG
jgi:hypothetical protein